MIAASKGYRFLCVTDSRCNLATRQLMEALGATVHVVTEPDLVGGLLGARIDYIRALCAADDRFVWLNQYTNPNAWKAHYRTTAPAIAREFPNLDVLFVGAGTTGTLMGCARYFHERHPHVRVVAVDPVGSVSFGAPAARRMIPGLGMAVRPPLLDQTYIDEVMHVEEPDAVRVCHRLAHRGFLFGGSTGTVVSGAVDWLAGHDADDLTAVALAPDLGERYLDTIYQANWVAGHLRRRHPAPGELASARRWGECPPSVLPRPDRSRHRRAVPRRGARRGGRCRTGVARRPLLRRPGRGLMLMARFCARVRKRPDLPSVSMKDVYQHLTVSEPGDGVRAAPGTPGGGTRRGAGRGGRYRAGVAGRPLLRRPGRGLDAHGPLLRSGPQT